MENITYLFGAGASAKCLPIVSKMSGQIKEISRLFEYHVDQATYRVGNTINLDDARSVIRDLHWLAEVCDIEKNFSVDTFAKKLLLSNRIEDYNKLKSILTLYFTLQQKFAEPDIRYDNFWASILNKKDEFPNNVRILSWNYDFQMELTYQEFINSDSLLTAAKALNIITNKNIVSNAATDKFAVFKLNGSATYNSEVIKQGHNYIDDNIKKSTENNVIEKGIDYYIKSDWRSIVSLTTHLSYAWEHDKESIFYKNLANSLSGTTVLVVIGYSFPYFNREVDKRILDTFIPNLEKVYFQDKNPDDVKERFRAINPRVSPGKLVSIHGTDQFYFPSEL